MFIGDVQETYSPALNFKKKTNQFMTGCRKGQFAEVFLDIFNKV